LIEQFNSISNWVASEILRESSVKQRAVLLHRFIIIAEESRALRNYNAVMAILSGLQSAPIYRLKHTWSLLPDRSWDIWDDLNALMNNENNFSLYRKVVRTSRPPRVPYIGVYLTDMVFIEDTHPDFLPHTQLANVMKLEYMASVLYVLEGCKKGAYDLTPVPALQACLLATPSWSEEQQRQQSLLLEPLGD
jgi:son of sevenless-like protein